MKSTLADYDPEVKQHPASSSVPAGSKREKPIYSLFDAGSGAASRQTPADFIAKRESGWDRQSVLHLTHYQINVMPSETLIEIVNQWCDVLPQPDVKSRLHYLNRNTLEQLVYLVRQACRCRKLACLCREQ